MKKIILAALLLSACGKEEKLKPEENKGSPQDLSLANFDPENSWVPVRKACDNDAIPFKTYETYRMDKDYLLSIYMSEDSDVRQCVVGEYRHRSVGSVSNTKTNFTEKGRFESANLMKQACWKKENGKPVGEAQSENLQVQLPSWEYKLERTQLREIVITGKNHPECLSGTLSLTLRY